MRPAHALIAFVAWSIPTAVLGAPPVPWEDLAGAVSDHLGCATPERGCAVRVWGFDAEARVARGDSGEIDSIVYKFAKRGGAWKTRYFADHIPVVVEEVARIHGAPEFEITKDRVRVFRWEGGPTLRYRPRGRYSKILLEYRRGSLVDPFELPAAQAGVPRARTHPDVLCFEFLAKGEEWGVIAPYYANLRQSERSGEDFNAGFRGEIVVGSTSLDAASERLGPLQVEYRDGQAWHVAACSRSTYREEIDSWNKRKRRYDEKARGKRLGLKVGGGVVAAWEYEQWAEGERWGESSGDR